MSSETSLDAHGLARRHAAVHVSRAVSGQIRRPSERSVFLGCRIYQALSGRRVTLGEDFAEILLDVVQGTPPPISSLLPDIPNAVDQAFAEALLKDPARRPGSVEAWTMSLAAEARPALLGRAWLARRARPPVDSRLATARSCSRDRGCAEVPRWVPSASGERSGDMTRS